MKSINLVWQVLTRLEQIHCSLSYSAITRFLDSGEVLVTHDDYAVVQFLWPDYQLKDLTWNKNYRKTT